MDDLAPDQQIAVSGEITKNGVTERRISVNGLTRRIYCSRGQCKGAVGCSHVVEMMPHLLVRNSTLVPITRFKAIEITLGGERGIPDEVASVRYGKTYPAYIEFEDGVLMTNHSPWQERIVPMGAESALLLGVVAIGIDTYMSVRKMILSVLMALWGDVRACESDYHPRNTPFHRSADRSAWEPTTKSSVERLIDRLHGSAHTCTECAADKFVPDPDEGAPPWKKKT